MCIRDRQIAEQEKEKLQIELDYSKDWYSIKRVAVSYTHLGQRKNGVQKIFRKKIKNVLNVLYVLSGYVIV